MRQEPVGAFECKKFVLEFSPSSVLLLSHVGLPALFAFRTVSYRAFFFLSRRRSALVRSRWREPVIFRYYIEADSFATLLRLRLGSFRK